MKKLTVLLITVLTVLTLCSCTNDVSKVSIDYGTSEIFTQQDREEAVEEIIAHFKNWSSGFTLYTISYAGDRLSQNELEYQQQQNEWVKECAVFYTSFMTPERDTGFVPEQVHSGWKYILGRADTGSWHIIGRGHG